MTITRFTLTLVVITFLGVFGDARHIHIIESRNSDAELLNLDSKADIEELSIDANRSFKPNFDPMNTILFFKTYPPCDVGFKRDVLGVCREVWD